MSQIVACPECGKKFKVAENKAGKKIKCSGCNAVVTIPDPDGTEAANGDPWDMPVEEEYEAPPPPPPPRPRRSPERERRPRHKEPRRSSGGGMPTALKLVLALVGSLVGAALLSCGGCYLMLHKWKNELEASTMKDAEKARIDGWSSPTGLGVKAASPPASIADAESTERLDVTKTEDPSSINVILNKRINQAVEITGFCDSIRGGPGAWGVVLSNKPDVGSTLNPCQLQNSDEAYSKVSPGQKVTVKGYRASDDDHEHALIGCIILKADGERCPEMTTEELLAAIEPLSESDFEKKYESKPCIVSGTIERVKQPDDEDEYDYELYLSTNGKRKVRVDYIANESSTRKNRTDKSKLKKGTRIKAFGKLGRTDSDVYLADGVLITVN